MNIVTYRPKAPDGGEYFTVEKWEKATACGWFIPDDGTGYYMNNDLVSDVSVWDQDAPRWATGVVWFNK